MDLENITLTNDRPGMTIEPQIEDATGSYVGQSVVVSSSKDAYEFQQSGLTQEEFEDAYSPEQRAEYYQQQPSEEVEAYSMELIDSQFAEPDEPSSAMAEIAWNMQLPDTPAHDIVQHLAVRYYQNSLSLEEAIQIAQDQGLSNDELRRAWTDIHQQFQKTLNK